MKKDGEGEDRNSLVNIFALHCGDTIAQNLHRITVVTYTRLHNFVICIQLEKKKKNTCEYKPKKIIDEKIFVYLTTCRCKTIASFRSRIST